jgi:hypothetical protein
VKGQGFDGFPQLLTLPEEDNYAPSHGRDTIRQCLERRESLGGDVSRGLDFDPPEFIANLEHKINLQTVPCSVVIELCLWPECSQSTVEFMGDELFEKQSALVGLRAVQRTVQEGIAHTKVEQIDLGVGDELALV